MSLLLKFDPDGGDLGRGAKVTALELAIVAPHVANILQALYLQESNGVNHYKYGFEVYTGDSKNLELALNDIKLPTDVMWFECDKRRIFELRGASGGVTIGLACYLVTR
jgi:hypothetical protein